MTPSSPTSPSGWAPDRAVWQSLKQAIASSSGFQRWQLEGQFNESIGTTNLDAQVRLYLRETLATLAY